MLGWCFERGRRRVSSHSGVREREKNNRQWTSLRSSAARRRAQGKIQSAHSLGRTSAFIINNLGTDIENNYVFFCTWARERHQIGGAGCCSARFGWMGRLRLILFPKHFLFQGIIIASEQQVKENAGTVRIGSRLWDEMMRQPHWNCVCVLSLASRRSQKNVFPHFSHTGISKIHSQSGFPHKTRTQLWLLL